MQHIRSQLITALVGIALVGMTLYGQSQGVRTDLVPAQGGIYTEAVVGHPTTLNPLLETDNPANRDLARLLYISLIKFNAEGLPIPDLAQSWAVTADGIAYTFVLRPNVRFADGQPIDVDDVLFTISLLQDPAFPHTPDMLAFWQAINVIKLNDSSFKVELPQPFAPFLDFMTFAVLPEHRLQGVTAGDLLTHPINFDPLSAGPFILDDLNISGGRITGISLTPNPTYYGYETTGQPFLASVEFRYYDQADQALQALQTGEVLGIANVPPNLLPTVLNTPNQNVFTARQPSYDIIFFNQASEELSFFQDKKVRQALMAGLNRQYIINTLLNGQALLATGPILPGSWAYSNNLRPIIYDPERAADLLDDAGWRYPAEALPGTENYVRQKDDRVLAFTLAVPDTPQHRAIGALIIENWNALGIQVELALVPPDDLQSDYLFTREFEALYTSFTYLGMPDPDPYPLWHQTQVESGQNYSGFANTGISELIEQARVNNAIADRRGLYIAFQARFTDETPAILLWYPVYNYVVSDRVRGVRVGQFTDPADRFTTIAQWYILTRRVITNQ